ncbi:hypothetical protein HDU98_000009 [Podochytrium sp. JEL0797]|nr:hypothetical protein HDU98_000009 [Podochytrium sp. JEL0797]
MTTTQKYSLLAVDIDGTLVNSSFAVTPRTVAALKRVHATGTQISLVTGRPDYLTRTVRTTLGPDLPVHVVAYNGALGLSPSGDKIFSQTLSSNDIAQLHSIAIKLGLTANFNEFGNEFISISAVTPISTDEQQEMTDRLAAKCSVEFKPAQREPRPDSVPLMFLFTNDPETHIEVVRQHVGDSVNVTLESFYLDCVSSSVHKGVGLTRLCEAVGIPVGKTVAFGDGHNDFEFLETAALGVAMANGVEVLRKKADRVTEFSNDEDGLAIELEGMLERGEFGKHV